MIEIDIFFFFFFFFDLKILNLFQLMVILFYLPLSPHTPTPSFAVKFHDSAMVNGMIY